MAFNENTRVKIPAILHLCRLGYTYLPLSGAIRDETTNIFTDIFSESISRINPSIEPDEIKKLQEKISLSLDNEDLGQVFYQMLISSSGVRLVDFSTPENFRANNSFHVVTELTYKNGEDEFRPDITLLINGMPLAFIEVKKPNNKEGIIAERDRINVRFKNKKFRKFVNISQLLVFSNNMEYDSESIVPVQGAFYSSASYNAANFNCFREEEKLNPSILLKPLDETIENIVLKDNNLSSIKYSDEFITNKDINTPTNRILTSLFSPERFSMLLKYGIAYVNSEEGLEKHIMRYPQIFATFAIKKTIAEGKKKGIIWHTQGSGKTALAFYNVHYLTDYLHTTNVVPKFYFIVDRIDLLNQASREFTSRGLIVHTVNSKEELLSNFKDRTTIYNLAGKREITVVNIHKFKEDKNLLRESDYDINIQRIYFLDEVHRSYDPAGCFLANLITSDRNAIHIGLTGTPLIGEGHRSRDVFGDYIHKYYYNASIADGYTLRLIREGIETHYRIALAEALKEIEILQGDADKKQIFAHEKFVSPMLEYILKDFLNSRMMRGDNTIGAMVICDSSEQAKKLFELFNRAIDPAQFSVSSGVSYNIAAEATKDLNFAVFENRRNLSAALILHDVDSKEERKNKVEEFKAGKIDLLFVYNMLLTGFDAKRLKKLYLARIIKDHNLLQALTRVNRPYKDFRYGFVVDFADIRKEFDATNKAYFEELQSELGDEMENYSNLFKTSKEIDEEINQIKEILFEYDLKNAENFSRQISQIEDRSVMLEIKKALANVRNLYNIIRLTGQYELLDRFDFQKIGELYNEAVRHLELLNLKESLQKNVDTTNLLNLALENVVFMFRKVSEDELVIADQLKDMLRKTREGLSINFDKKDPKFVSLYDELKRLFNQKNLDEISQEEMKRNIKALQSIFDKVTELNRANNLLKAKYENDAKYARVHKRIMESGSFSKRKIAICNTLTDVKKQADEKVLLNRKVLDNEGYFEQFMMQTVITNFEKNKMKLDAKTADYVNNCVVKEYLNEYQGIYTW